VDDKVVVGFEGKPDFHYVRPGTLPSFDACGQLAM
jgi:hypothetical protein